MKQEEQRQDLKESDQKKRLTKELNNLQKKQKRLGSQLKLLKMKIIEKLKKNRIKRENLKKKNTKIN